MPRNMSFMLTTDQVRSRTKTVTRRNGWWNLKPGDILVACEKCQGLKRGETINRLATIRVVDVRQEPLRAITQEDCTKEGFPHYSRTQFVELFLRSHKGTHWDSVINRIEFEYIEDNGHQLLYH